MMVDRSDGSLALGIPTFSLIRPEVETFPPDQLPPDLAATRPLSREAIESDPLPRCGSELSSDSPRETEIGKNSVPLPAMRNTPLSPDDALCPGLLCREQATGHGF